MIKNSWIIAVAFLFSSCNAQTKSNATAIANAKKFAVVKTDVEWKKQLTPLQFDVTRAEGTEQAFTGKYADDVTIISHTSKTFYFFNRYFFTKISLIN